LQAFVGKVSTFNLDSSMFMFLACFSMKNIWPYKSMKYDQCL
jgi:hypothetical protein